MHQDPRMGLKALHDTDIRSRCRGNRRDYRGRPIAIDKRGLKRMFLACVADDVMSNVGRRAVTTNLPVARLNRQASFGRP